jgi:hypothetical protein
MKRGSALPAYQHFERVFTTAPNRLLPSEDTVDFLDDPVATSVAAREQTETPAPTPSTVRIVQPAKCKIDENEAFECAESREWWTANSKKLNCQDMFALMEQFLDDKKHPHMSEYFLSKQGDDDSDITLNTFCGKCKTFYLSNINAWYSCYVNKCQEDSARFGVFHAVAVKDGKLVKRKLKSKCNHRKILDTGIEIEDIVTAT